MERRNLGTRSRRLHHLSQPGQRQGLVPRSARAVIPDTGEGILAATGSRSASPSAIWPTRDLRRNAYPRPGSHPAQPIGFTKAFSGPPAAACTGQNKTPGNSHTLANHTAEVGFREPRQHEAPTTSFARSADRG